MYIKFAIKLIFFYLCVIISNLTRNIRPYAFIENVVTHADYRGKGCATACLNYAKEIAQKSDCYKMMLLTGSKNDRTLNFYKKAGYADWRMARFYLMEKYLTGN